MFFGAIHVCFFQKDFSFIAYYIFSDFDGIYMYHQMNVFCATGLLEENTLPGNTLSLSLDLSSKSLLFTRGQFWPSGIVVACVCLSVCVSVCVCVRQPWACPCHKSPRVQARTTKFGQKVQNNLVKVPIVFGGDCRWPSRSNLTWKAKFTPFWACPRHNSSSIEVRTTKFEQKMQTNLLVVHIVLGGDWLRPSWSNLTR